MKRFVKNEAVAPAIQAFATLDKETFVLYNERLTIQERQALNFIDRAISLASGAHLDLALETKQPMVQVDRLLTKLTELGQGVVFLQKLMANGLDINQVVTVDGHRSLVRQPLAFPAGLYTVSNHKLFQVAVSGGLDLTYTTPLQRSDRFLETDDINALDIVLLLTHEQALDGKSLFFFEHEATVGLVERLQRTRFDDLHPIIDEGRYDVTFRYAKHFPLFYAIVGRQTKQFPKMLAHVLEHPERQAILDDALLAFHNYQPGLAASLGSAYYDDLLTVGKLLKTEARIDFNTLSDEYVLTEYLEILSQLRDQ